MPTDTITVPTLSVARDGRSYRRGPSSARPVDNRGYARARRPQPPRAPDAPTSAHPFPLPWRQPMTSDLDVDAGAVRACASALAGSGRGWRGAAAAARGAGRWATTEPRPGR